MEREVYSSAARSSVMLKRLAMLSAVAERMDWYREVSFYTLI